MSGATSNSSEKNKSYWGHIGLCRTVGGKFRTLFRESNSKCRLATKGDNHLSAIIKLTITFNCVIL